jgi:uncharacterized protein YdcH (DUF465 family)
VLFAIAEEVSISLQTNAQRLSPEFQSAQSEIAHLHARHSQCSRLLEQLTSKPFPTPEQQLEELRLKKLKLYLKDRMNALSR